MFLHFVYAQLRLDYTLRTPRITLTHMHIDYLYLESKVV
jgi:hypothetical protein